MRLPRWLRRKSGGRPLPQLRREERGQEPLRPDELRTRRWDAAKTDRFNKAHWQQVSGQTINLDLDAHLESLRTRCEYEASTNSILEGIINTHVTDLVGEEGPTLQVISADTEYNDRVEREWFNWWAMPDAAGKLSGVELLDLWVRTLWTNGEILAQIISVPAANGPVKFRVHNLAPRRLGQPTSQAASPDIVMGVRRDRLNRPLGYFIDQTPEGILTGSLFNFQEIPARDILHEFVSLEAGQARGVPWLATVLQDAADLRDYDIQVMDAARAAADTGVYIYTNHPDANFVEVNEEADIPRRSMATLPPGYQPMQLNPQQPSTQYKDFHDEKIRQLGRPQGMPLMTVKLDSREHNYSSARFDGQIYDLANKKKRKWLSRTVLNRLVFLLIRELEAGGKIGPRPENMRLEWSWPPRPHVDPLKEEKAISERLSNQTSTLREECAAKNRDWEEVLKQLAIEKKRREELGLPEPGAKPNTPEMKSDGDDEDDKTTKPDRKEGQS